MATVDFCLRIRNQQSRINSSLKKKHSVRTKECLGNFWVIPRPWRSSSLVTTTTTKNQRSAAEIVRSIRTHFTDIHTHVLCAVVCWNDVEVERGVKPHFLLLVGGKRGEGLLFGNFGSSHTRIVITVYQNEWKRRFFRCLRENMPRLGGGEEWKRGGLKPKSAQQQLGKGACIDFCYRCSPKIYLYFQQYICTKVHIGGWLIFFLYLRQEQHQKTQ